MTLHIDLGFTVTIAVVVSATVLAVAGGMALQVLRRRTSEGSAPVEQKRRAEGQKVD
jgi:hypothetical protein